MIIDKLNIAIGVIVGGMLVLPPAYLLAKREAKSELQAESAKEALKRVNQLETNNAKFKNGTAHDRCVIFMRDSGLPISECD